MTQGLDHGLHRQLKDAVYLQLRDDIISGALPAGAVLREVELVARFGVSKTPLRDALVRLQKDGFVDIPPYRSAVVTGYSDTDLREIYELRELLEGACARQAALHIGGGAPGQLAQVRPAPAARPSARAGGPGHGERIGRPTTGIPGRRAKSVAEHQTIYEAIAQRDGDGAEALMREHIGSVLADQLASMAGAAEAPQTRAEDP